MKNKIYEYLDDSIKHSKMLKVYAKELIEIADILGNSNFIVLAGNGGSAATASHMANDLHRVCKLRAVSLTDNVSILTAWANDDCYENIFIKQLENRLYYIDVIIILSGSGDSENLVRLAKWGIDNGIKVIAFLGTDGGKIGKMKDVKMIHIESDQIHTEDWHLMLDHLLCELIKGK
jgi:D-sedoheptulose 7-phosphate isomerase